MDLDEAKVEQIRAGQAPIHEPGLGEALKQFVADERLSASTELADAGSGTDLVYLCVGTPQDEDGSADLSALEAAARVSARPSLARARRSPRSWS